MLLPISHENVEARRWPILTTILVLLNVLCFFALPTGLSRETEKLYDEIGWYWHAHPNLETPKAIQERGIPIRGMKHAITPDAPPATPEDQAHLDELGARFLAAVDDSPSIRWGYIPKRGGFVQLFTSQFLHAGIFHLVFNMWFMWLCACNLEDRWGRWLFLPMYLSAGAVAAFVYGLASPESTAALVGASGSIAGAMGAFLVLFAKTRIRFVYWFGRRPGTFAAPAWVMLPLWLANEVLWGIFFPVQDGTAHVAHIAGFVYGAAFAGVMIVTGLDKKLDAATERKVTTSQDARILDAGRLIDERRPAEAIRILDAYLATQPNSIDGLLELLRAATALGDPSRLGPAYARLVEAYLRMRELDAAQNLFAEATQLGHAAAIGAVTRGRLADQLLPTHPDKAFRIYASCVPKEITDGAAAQMALTYADLLIKHGKKHDAELVLDRVDRAGIPGFARKSAELRAQLGDRSIAL